MTTGSEELDRIVDWLMGIKPDSEVINGIRYCSPYCPFLDGERESVNKRCVLLNKELDFYDWHLAICEPESEDE